MPLVSTAYRVDGAGKSSAVLWEAVRDIVTASVSPGTTITAGQTVTFMGTVTPDRTGHVIFLERKNGNGPGFHIVQAGIIGPGSSFSLAHAVFTVGTNVFRLHVPNDGVNGPASSAALTIMVNPPAGPLAPEPPKNSSQPSLGQL
jgi:hypothetical protein